MCEINVITFIFIFVFGCVITALGYDSYQQKMEETILEKCENGNSFTINGVEVHCGIIHTEVNIEAVKYHQVKQCNKLISDWTNDQ